MSHRASTTRRRRAFTLIESIATITIVGTLAAVVSGIVFSATQAFTDSALRLQLHAELSAAMDRVQRELQGIALDTGSGNGAPLITSISPTAINYGSGRSIALSGTNLVLNDNGVDSANLLTNVSAFNIQALGNTGAALAANLSGAQIASVQRLEVTITVQRNGISETLRTRVFPRGIMAGAGS